MELAFKGSMGKTSSDKLLTVFIQLSLINGEHASSQDILQHLLSPPKLLTSPAFDDILRI